MIILETLKDKVFFNIYLMKIFILVFLESLHFSSEMFFNTRADQ